MSQTTVPNLPPNRRRVRFTRFTEYDMSVTLGNVYEVVKIDDVGGCIIIDDYGQEFVLFRNQFVFVGADASDDTDC